MLHVRNIRLFCFFLLFVLSFVLSFVLFIILLFHSLKLNCLDKKYIYKIYIAIVFVCLFCPFFHSCECGLFVHVWVCKMVVTVYICNSWDMTNVLVKHTHIYIYYHPSSINLHIQAGPHWYQQQGRTEVLLRALNTYDAQNMLSVQATR